ncbi:RteC domain-containing protein [Bacteroides sp. 51]|uniref:RteC domain-containing protein n=1 Tax=Bacteroides sp. 51 TaxID=2302938 RepID=UPI0013D48CA2|nr:RteC domain-containing protein [Bacteroides sp. 51]NDV81621.1 RteC protein [Bacteroides sp. 51]
MNDFIRNLNKDTAQKIRDIETMEKDMLKRAFLSALVLVDANLKLKNFTISYQFKDENEEIFFFKYLKPQLVSQLIYHCQVYNIEMNYPISGVHNQREYLNRELENLQDYIDRRPEFYSYYRLGATHNDVSYFTRDKLIMGRQYLEPKMSEREPRYSTNGDYKRAKLLANEQLEVLLKTRLNELEKPHNEEQQLSWATKKTYLIELLYALDSFHAFGKIPLKRIVYVIQKLLGIDLGNISSAFAEMRERNEPTPFLDGLKDALLERMKRINTRKKKK